MTIKEIFLDHPHSMNETYWQHFCFALGAALYLFKAIMAIVIHAFIPCLFKTYASSHVIAFADKFIKRTSNTNHTP